jgi:hypothetical protein
MIEANEPVFNISSLVIIYNFFLNFFLKAVLEHKKEVLNQHLKEKLVYDYLELRDPPFKQ